VNETEHTMRHRGVCRTVRLQELKGDLVELFRLVHDAHVTAILNYMILCLRATSLHHGLVHEETGKLHRGTGGKGLTLVLAHTVPNRFS